MSNENLAAGCRFCDIAHGSGSTPMDRPWRESKNYVAIASVGALVPGWSLVVPKAHGLNTGKHCARPDYNDFVRDVVSDIEDLYGPAVIFEHGSNRSDSETSCGTAHAHLHVVPIKFDLVANAELFDTSYQWKPCKFSQIREMAGEKEYLFAANRYSGPHSAGVICLLKKGTSQFFRRVVAKQLYLDEIYNYKIHPQTETCERTYFELSQQAITRKVA